MLEEPNTTPRLPGVYYLIHRGSGCIFVGATTNLRQRKAIWASYLRRGMGSSKVPGMPDAPIAEWQFRVVRADATLTHDQQERLVQATIERAVRQDLTVLNRRVRGADGPDGASHAQPAALTAREQVMGMMGATILGPEGDHLTYGEAANLLGRSIVTVKRTVRRLREQTGAATFTLDQLQRRTRGDAK